MKYYYLELGNEMLICLQSTSKFYNFISLCTYVVHELIIFIILFVKSIFVVNVFTHIF